MRGKTWAVSVVVGLLCVALGAEAQVAAPEKPVTYTGHVVGPDGKPVAGAEILLSVPANDRGDYRVEASARSGADGAFSLSGAQPKPDTPAKVIARAEGFALAQFHATPGEPVEVALAPAASLRVTFLGPDGKPVPDLRVTPVLAIPRTPGVSFYTTFPVELADALARKTDTVGVVTFGALPARASVQLAVTDTRFARLDYKDNLQTDDGPGPVAATIRLRAGGSISGTVIYGTTGKPAANVEIVAQAIDRAGGGGGWGRATTNERGEYRMEQVGESVYNVMLGTNTPDFERKWTAVARRDVHVGAGEHVAKQDMTLIEGILITGKVFRGDTGAGVPGISIGLHGPEHPRSSAMIRSSAPTNAEGEYTLRAPPGANYVYLYSRAPDGYRDAKAQDVEIVDEGPVTVDFSLPRKPGKPVVGRVLGPDGKPLAGAFVSAESKDGDMRGGVSVKTDATGAFRFEAIAPGTLLRGSGGKGLETQQATRVNGGEADVTLRLEKRIVVTLGGKVTDAEDEPIAGARVQVITHEGQYGSGMGAPEVTDAEGKYRIAGLSPSGRYTVDAWAGGKDVRLRKTQ